MTQTRLNIHHVARIEGHGNVNIEVQDGVLTDVEMNITEPARMFEQMVRGRSCTEVSYIASRICGICSPNHAITSLLCLEDAMGIEVSERTSKLRSLLIRGSYLQNHATHLYVLAAPDYVGLQSAFPLATAAPDVLSRALEIKRLGNELCNAVGGRSVHPNTCVIGGFTAEPDPKVLLALADRLQAIADDCIATGDLFGHFEVPDFKSQGDLLCLVEDDDYAVISGQTRALLSAWTRPVGEYRDFIIERSRPYSNAKFSTLPNGRTFMTGAIARVNQSWGKLSPAARIVAAKAGLRPVWLNSFKNNLSQAIELVDCVERCAQLCREIAADTGSSAPAPFEFKSGHGVAATEAPRGTVYYEIDVDDKGRVEYANILTPTAQSLANLENDLRLFVPRIVDRDPDTFKMLVEKLVRAYDPCLSCAVH
ncbi:MAG: Ni/Fe hydrogenase subunit alpha [Coriobacteriales bacterium]|nr:Ni/Fe hydrogenase subunit alpha [Coriobacteriales bacterium]MBQ6586432.1 Ni/Fe hydrogenase subunit alpha [Coriobacteriales bacterium]